jgi:hypothetical protein
MKRICLAVIAMAFTGCQTSTSAFLTIAQTLITQTANIAQSLHGMRGVVKVETVNATRPVNAMLTCMDGLLIGASGTVTSAALQGCERGIQWNLDPAIKSNPLLVALQNSTNKLAGQLAAPLTIALPLSAANLNLVKGLEAKNKAIAQTIDQGGN